MIQDTQQKISELLNREEGQSNSKKEQSSCDNEQSSRDEQEGLPDTQQSKLINYTVAL